MKYLSNIYDPSRKDAQEKMICLYGETQAQAWERQKKWLVGKVIGKPRSTSAYTMQQLERMGMVGVYAYEPGEMTLKEKLKSPFGMAAKRSG